MKKKNRNCIGMTSQSRPPPTKSHMSISEITFACSLQETVTKTPTTETPEDVPTETPSVDKPVAQQPTAEQEDASDWTLIEAMSTVAAAEEAKASQKSPVSSRKLSFFFWTRQLGPRKQASSKKTAMARWMKTGAIGIDTTVMSRRDGYDLTVGNCVKRCWI